MATAQVSPDNDVVMAEIFITAPPARVFQAITDPAQTAKWWDKKAFTASPQRKLTFAPAENG